MGHSTVIEMGEMACAITASDQRLTRLLARRYEGFFTDRTPHFMIEVELVPSPGDHGSPIEIEGGPVASRLWDHALRLTGVTFSADFDFKARKGLIRQSLNLTPLDLLLKAVYAHYLLQEEAFFLHACALVRKGSGHLFFGPTGSGKSTLAQLAGEGVLADELVIVRRQGSHDGSPYAVHGTPFWGGSNLKAPLAGLYALRPDSSTSLTPLTQVEALRRLLPCLGSFCLSPQDQAHLFGLASLLVQQIPFAELRFSLDPTLWSYLDAHPS